MANYLCNYSHVSGLTPLTVMIKTIDMKNYIIAALLVISTAVPCYAQQTLTLEECRRMAVSADKDLEQARTSVEMAGYDRKIARANYLPNVAAVGAYMYNNRDIALVNDTQSQMLQNAGTLLEQQVGTALGGAVSQIGTQMSGAMTQLMTAIQTNPALAAEYMSSPMWQTVLGMVQGLDPASLAGQLPSIADPVNALGREIDDALHPDIHNVWLGAITVQQPVFVGGKIIYSNQMAALAEDLAKTQYDMKYADVVVDVDQAYWQIVSIANKKKLAESYADLLHSMESDVRTAVEAGVKTESDLLQVRVKANEADMLLSKSSNGLVLAKMLLCKKIGLPLDSEITLADESLEAVPVPSIDTPKNMDDVYADRPETRSLGLASQIYDRKAKIARADMMPKVALMANYLLTNPNVYNGFQNTWQGGMFNAGVTVSVPIFHGFEAGNKYRKAKAEATLYQTRYDDAKELINLQITQQRHLLDEALEKLQMASSNLDSAEENLRKATIGHEAGVIPTNTAISAHTAWLSAHSEYIDAGIELQMAYSNLQRAEGNYQSE